MCASPARCEGQIARGVTAIGAGHVDDDAAGPAFPQRGCALGIEELAEVQKVGVLA